MALEEVAVIFPVHPDCTGSKTLSKLYTTEDREMCQKLGATLTEEGVYALNDKVIPPSGYQTELIDLYHSIAHQGV